MNLLHNLFVTPAYAAARITEESPDASSGAVNKIADMIGFVLGHIPLWIAAFVVFVLAVGVAKIVKRTVENRIGEKIDEAHQEVLILSGRISYVTTLTIGVTVALKIAGIDLTTILAAVAFGIGFALRDLIMNFIAGIYILMSRQFALGDFIKVNGVIGKVEEIQARATILKAVDGTKVIVPNADIFSNTVISLTSNPMRRVSVPLYVAYGTDLDYAMMIALRVMREHPKLLKKPKPSVAIKDYGDSSVDLSARFWVTRGAGWFKIRSEMINLFDKAFTEAGIRVPYNILHLETSADTVPEEKEEKELEVKMRKTLEEEAKLSAAMESSSVATPNTPGGSEKQENEIVSAQVIPMQLQPAVAIVPIATEVAAVAPSNGSGVPQQPATNA